VQRLILKEGKLGSEKFLRETSAREPRKEGHSIRRKEKRQMKRFTSALKVARLGKREKRDRLGLEEENRWNRLVFRDRLLG